MIRPSFIPPLAIRELRDLTRRRRQLIGENSRERNRVQKVLEDANVKLGDVLSDVFCVSGRLMLAALLDGKMTAEQIADLAKKKAREKIPQITASVADHRLSDHQRFLIRHALRHLEFLDQEVEALNQEIRRRMEDPALAEAFHLLQSIPVSRKNQPPASWPRSVPTWNSSRQQRSSAPGRDCVRRITRVLA